MREIFKVLKEKVFSSNEYSFLKEQGEIMLLTFGGSYSYGTNNEDSDIDIRGILAETPNRVLGLEKFEQFEDEPTDTVLYSFNKMIGLLINSNPNTIEMLGHPEEDYLILSDEGRKLLHNKNLFLSKRCINSFGGYAIAQLRRLKNALAMQYKQEEKEEHIYQTIDNSMHHLHSHYAPFSNDALSIYLGDSTKEDMKKEILVDVAFKDYPLRDFIGIMSEMNAIAKSYDKLTHRNRKKDEPHLLKHSMHLIRLYLMCIDILDKHEIITYRIEDLKLLMDIRKGLYSYEEIFKLADEYEKKFNEAKKRTTLPDEPDLYVINKFMVEINKNCLLK